MGNYAICGSCSTIIIMSKMSSAVTKKLLQHNQLFHHRDSSKAIIKKNESSTMKFFERSRAIEQPRGGNDSFTNSQIFSKSPTRRPSITATVSADTGRGEGGEGAEATMPRRCYCKRDEWRAATVSPPIYLFINYLLVMDTAIFRR